MTWLRASWKKWRHRADRTIPSLLLIGLLFGLAVINFAFAGWLIHGLWLWEALIAILALLAFIDALSLWGLTADVNQTVPTRPQLRVGLEISNELVANFTISRIESVDFGLPEQFRPLGPPQLRAGGEGGATFVQSVLPLRRGYTFVGPIDVKVRSRFGLWQRLMRIGEPEQVLVLPDVTSWRKAVIALQQSLAQEGTHLKRVSSGDREFSYIAEYTPDDDPRRINWSATARRGRLMKNVYQAEQGQQVIVAVDASRYMQVGLPDGKTRLDYALECASAIASTALHMGDRVGVMAFTHQLLFHLPPRRGPEHWRQVVELLAGVEAQTVQGGYETLLRSLGGIYHRHSMLVIVSELEGIGSDPEFLRVLNRVQRHHPTLFITLADMEASRRLRQIPARAGAVAELAAANWALRERQAARKELLAQGVNVVEAPPGDVVVKAVETHLRRRLRLRP